MKSLFAFLISLMSSYNIFAFENSVPNKVRILFDFSVNYCTNPGVCWVDHVPKAELIELTCRKNICSGVKHGSSGEAPYGGTYSIKVVSHALGSVGNRFYFTFTVSSGPGKEAVMNFSQEDSIIKSEFMIASSKIKSRASEAYYLPTLTIFPNL